MRDLDGHQLTRAEQEQLRRLAGHLTLAEWIAGGQQRPHRITDRHALVGLAVATRAAADAKLVAQAAPWLQGVTLRVTTRGL